MDMEQPPALGFVVGLSMCDHKASLWAPRIMEPRTGGSTSNVTMGAAAC